MKTTLLFKFFAVLALFFNFASADFLTLGDSFYVARAEGSANNFAKPENINGAIKNYDLAINDTTLSNAKREQAAWKLLRAYYFLGCYVMKSNTDKKNLFEEAKNEGEYLQKKFPKNNEVAYWYSVNMALWAREVNPITAYRAGSVDKSLQVAKQLIASEKNGDLVSAARGYQILGQAHQKIPHILFLINWPNKDSAAVYLQKSFQLNDKDLATRLFLAESYIEREDYDSARKLLSPVLNKSPSKEEYLEDERNLKKIKKAFESL